MTKVEWACAFGIFLITLAVISAGIRFPPTIICTESFCQGDKVRIVDTQKTGIILEYKGDHSNKVWQIYVDSEKLFYIIPENRLINEE